MTMTIKKGIWLEYLRLNLKQVTDHFTCGKPQNTEDQIIVMISVFLQYKTSVKVC